MTTATLNEMDAQVAEERWAEYCRTHDTLPMTGQTVGIDPVTGRMWFGESIPDVVEQRDAAGVRQPLHFIRIGSDAYYRKGART